MTFRMSVLLLLPALVIGPALRAQAVFHDSKAPQVSFASAEGGILLSLVKAWPTSFFISAISFAAYVVARIVGASRLARAGRTVQAVVASEVAAHQVEPERPMLGLPP